MRGGACPPTVDRERTTTASTGGSVSEQTEPGVHGNLEPGENAVARVAGGPEHAVVRTEDRRWLFIGLIVALVVALAVGIAVASAA
jgi:hypothetical protein